jgi:uncharacterized cupin superfamily protein
VPFVGIVHWDDIERHRAAKGEMDATWQQLAKPAGAVGIGVNRMRVAPGKLPTPPHSHGASEEIYYVLGGAGLAWQDEQVHEVRAGDCVIHRADEMEHTFIAGPNGLDCLVFGTRHPTEFGWLPRSGAVRIGWPWIEGRVDDPWDVEAEVPPLEVGDPAPRPPNIINIDEAEREVTRRRDTALLATDERSLLAGFYWERLFPGAVGAPPHCHSEEEEAFVMLEGDGTLGLWPSPLAASAGSVREDLPIRAGHVVVRPPGTRIAHSFRAGLNGLTMLIYGTRKTNDMCWYPRSNKIFWRGLGVIGRIESLDYYDGEPDDDEQQG